MLAPENMLFHLNGHTQEEVVQKVVEQADKIGKIADVSKTVQAVLNREKESTTGFGKGVAIPHGKTSGVIEPVLMFAKLDQDVEWKSLDEKPVNMLFMILVPETAESEHLQILAKLARKLMHDDFVEHLRSLNDAETVATYLNEQLA